MVKLREHSGVKKSTLEKLITIMEKYVHKSPGNFLIWLVTFR